MSTSSKCAPPAAGREGSGQPGARLAARPAGALDPGLVLAPAFSGSTLFERGAHWALLPVGGAPASPPKCGLMAVIPQGPSGASHLAGRFEHIRFSESSIHRQPGLSACLAPRPPSPTPEGLASQSTVTQSPGLGQERNISGFLRRRTCPLLALRPDGIREPVRASGDPCR